MVRTIRARRALLRVRIGRLVAVQAASLPDGTLAASRIRTLGRAGRAHFRATVAVSMKCVHTASGLLLKRLQSDTALWEG